MPRHATSSGLTCQASVGQIDQDLSGDVQGCCMGRQRYLRHRHRGQTGSGAGRRTRGHPLGARQGFDFDTKLPAQGERKSQAPQQWLEDHSITSLFMQRSGDAVLAAESVDGAAHATMRFSAVINVVAALVRTVLKLTLSVHIDYGRRRRRHQIDRCRRLGSFRRYRCGYLALMVNSSPTEPISLDSGVPPRIEAGTP
jgi:hypothetical protein